MKNVSIEKVNEHNYIVRATTKRFGENEIMYQGITLEAAKQYATANNTECEIKLKGFDK